jgi:hypothetical protein
MLSVPVFPSQPLVPVRLQPDVTIEEALEDFSVEPVTATAPTATPLVLKSRPVRPSHHTTLVK